MNNVIRFKTPLPPLNVEACLDECHYEFCSTLIRGGGGGGLGGNKQYNGECLKCTHYQKVYQLFLQLLVGLSSHKSPVAQW